MKKVIAWDLGTGGNKASLYDMDGVCVDSVFVPYNTYYGQRGWHEQEPEDWWKAVAGSTQMLLARSKTKAEDIFCCSISGHSMGVVPVDKAGNLLMRRTPIWSDMRAEKQVLDFFIKTDEKKWYLKTGGGFTPMCYSVFKINWLKENAAEVYRRAFKVLGTKDYILLKLTGRFCTDYSYASSSGVWDLEKWQYSDELLRAAELDAALFPEAVASASVIGRVGKRAAAEMGLSPGVYVAAGGVDDACMALGAMAFKEGRAYASLGSSPWIALATRFPLTDVAARPYTFAHVVPGMFVSALCSASGGSAFRWIREQLCRDIKAKDGNAYDQMVKEAAAVPPGANRLVFNPSLAGGMPIDGSYKVRGGFVGLDLLHTRADLIRAAMEGVAMSLEKCLAKLRTLSRVEEPLLLTGGGSKSVVWRQIFADVFGSAVSKSNVDEQAAALGAAACALVGSGCWRDFSKIDALHTGRKISEPVFENRVVYKRMMEVYERAADHLSELGEMLAKI
jgi:xylulokinase